MTAVEIFRPGAIDPILEAIKTEARQQAAALDISTEANRKALASLAFKVAKTKTFIDGQRKALVADEKKRLSAIDAEGRRIWGELESLQAEVRKPLTEWEEADKARIAGHEANITETLNGGTYSLQNWQSLSVEAMRDRLNEILALGSWNWEEFRSRGELAIKTASVQIQEAIAKREKYDAEQAELARLRAEAAEREQKEREERIAQAARERAEREAREREELAAKMAEAERQKIEREKEEAEARARRAEEARKAAEEKAQRDAAEAAERAEREKQVAVEAERRRAEAETQRQRDEQARLERNKKHRAKIHGEITASLLNNTSISGEAANDVLDALVKGCVAHVAITY